MMWLFLYCCIYNNLDAWRFVSDNKQEDPQWACRRVYEESITHEKLSPARCNFIPELSLCTSTVWSMHVWVSGCGVSAMGWCVVKGQHACGGCWRGRFGTGPCGGWSFYSPASCWTPGWSCVLSSCVWIVSTTRLKRRLGPGTTYSV